METSKEGEMLKEEAILRDKDLPIEEDNIRETSIDTHNQMGGFQQVHITTITIQDLHPPLQCIIEDKVMIITIQTQGLRVTIMEMFKIIIVMIEIITPITLSKKRIKINKISMETMMHNFKTIIIMAKITSLIVRIRIHTIHTIIQMVMTIIRDRFDSVWTQVLVMK